MSNSASNSRSATSSSAAIVIIVDVYGLLYSVSLETQDGGSEDGMRGRGTEPAAHLWLFRVSLGESTIMFRRMVRKVASCEWKELFKVLKS